MTLRDTVCSLCAVPASPLLPGPQAELVLGRGHTLGALRRPISAGARRPLPQWLRTQKARGADEAWGPEHRSLSGGRNSKMIQLLGPRVRTEQEVAGATAQATPAGLAVFLATGRKGRPMERCWAPAHVGMPRAPHCFTNKSSQSEYILLCLVDQKTYIFFTS